MVQPCYRKSRNNNKVDHQTKDMAKVAKISENAKAVNNSSKEVTLKEKVTTPAPAPTKEDAPAPTFEDKTPTMLADPQYCLDAICEVLWTEEATPRNERGKNIIDRQFYGIARSTTLALLCGGQEELTKRISGLESNTTQKIIKLLEDYPRQAVVCYFEICILRGVQLSINEFTKCYITTEEVKQRGELLGAKILEKYDTLGVSEEDADAFVRRFSSAKISDKKLLEYIKVHGVDYDTAVTALSSGGKKMRLDFKELKKLGIYEINYTSNSAVKDFVYFIIK